MGICRGWSYSVCVGLSASQPHTLHRPLSLSLRLLLLLYVLIRHFRSAVIPLHASSRRPPVSSLPPSFLHSLVFSFPHVFALQTD